MSKHTFGHTIAAGGAIERFCAANESGHAKADHSPSCMLCCGCRDATILPPREPGAVAALRRPIASAASMPFIRRAPSLAPESGWASSWSSQAPPARS
ncbi:hypothetical protein [Methylosinus sporium]|uniref:hypothetical protein n=1 Tax=Methylosinus sporium TaxID=428 RepID=UPI003839D502